MISHEAFITNILYSFVSDTETRYIQYFPAQLVAGFPLSDLLDKPWSQVSSILPPRTCLRIFVAHRVQHSHWSSIVIEYCHNCCRVRPSFPCFSLGVAICLLVSLFFRLKPTVHDTAARRVDSSTKRTRHGRHYFCTNTRNISHKAA